MNSFRNQQATIYLQTILKGANDKTIEFIVNELRGTYSEIIKDKNGNYFISDLISKCEQKDRIVLIPLLLIQSRFLFRELKVKLNLTIF